MNNRLDFCWIVRASIMVFVTLFFVSEVSAQPRRAGWKTNWNRTSINLNELLSGGPPKDGIPAIDRPQFVSIEEASGWLKKKEPVISLGVKGEQRAYPLQILTYHEIVNDHIQGEPVVVTFCPLCYAAIAYSGTINGSSYTFGVSGMLRQSDMVMYDRQTESLWQQLEGKAIVGDMLGVKLKALPAQIISFEQFQASYPEGTVLSKNTGYRRDYGNNPYVGYDDIDKRPYQFAFQGAFDSRLPPMEKVIAISADGSDKAYPHRVTRKKHVIQDEVGNQPLVIFHGKGAVSALDKKKISSSREIGSTGVFDPRINGQTLHFEWESGKIIDRETQSEWDVTGKVIGGKLLGKELKPLPHGDFFAFAWFAFKPNTKIYKD